jgi:hypothetical protein
VLSKLLVKPAYITVAKGTQIVGNFGHASAILRRPVLEGNYFMEFIVKPDAKKDRPISCPSALRVGICVNSYDAAFPLGCGESVAYKSKDGFIVHNNEIVGKSEPYSVGDVIGVCMRVAPLSKHINP